MLLTCNRCLSVGVYVLFHLCNNNEYDYKGHCVVTMKTKLGQFINMTANCAKNNAYMIRLELAGWDISCNNELKASF